MATAAARLARGVLKGGRRLLILPVGGSGQVPGPLTGKRLARQRIRERAVRPAPGRRRRAVVHRGPHQGMRSSSPSPAVPWAFVYRFRCRR